MKIDVECPKRIWFRCPECQDVVDIELPDWLDDGDSISCPKCHKITIVHLMRVKDESTPDPLTAAEQDEERCPRCALLLAERAAKEEGEAMTPPLPTPDDEENMNARERSQEMGYCLAYPPVSLDLRNQKANSAFVDFVADQIRAAVLAERARKGEQA